MPGDQPAAADRDEHRVDRPRALAQDLHADGALPGDHVRVVVGMHEGQAALALEFHGVAVGVRIAVAMQHHLRAARRHRVHLDLRRGHRHHDHRAAAELLRRERDALRVVARARRDHALGQLRRRQVGHLVVRAAQLEREHRLQVLALEQQAVAQAPRQHGRQFERRFDRHVVDARLQDAFEIIFAFHRKKPSTRTPWIPSFRPTAALPRCLPPVSSPRPSCRCPRKPCCSAT